MLAIVPASVFTDQMAERFV